MNAADKFIEKRKVVEVKQPSICERYFRSWQEENKTKDLVVVGLSSADYERGLQVEVLMKVVEVTINNLRRRGTLTDRLAEGSGMKGEVTKEEVWGVLDYLNRKFVEEENTAKFWRWAEGLVEEQKS